MNITGSHRGQVSSEPKIAPRARTGCFRAMPRAAFMASMASFAQLPFDCFDWWYAECGSNHSHSQAEQGSVARVFAFLKVDSGISCIDYVSSSRISRSYVAIMLVIGVILRHAKTADWPFTECVRASVNLYAQEGMRSLVSCLQARLQVNPD